MTPLSWPCPLPGGGTSEEYALAFDRGRTNRLLVVPALFDEANRLRRQSVEVMRRLDGAGVDCFLPDLPGCNESLQPLEVQSPEDWRDAVAFAAMHFGATHVLGIRGGCLLTPEKLPCRHYAPINGASILRQMIRARILAAREAGTVETQQDLMDQAMAEGIELTGYRLSAEFIDQFQSLAPREGPNVQEIGQDMVGGAGLWLRAEPDENRQQADALAAILAIGLAA
ncbi:MAG: hypothetical protein R3E09_17185 [Novosphingobium sp.]|nr:hypothetical protein [Novosphingobium sp.]MCB2077652.1 hypothetical protein [Novosphingobium sp.]